MGRLPIRNNIGGEDLKLNKGLWTEAEDAILSAYVKANGEGNWRKLPKLAGLARCRKSCRLRWINYLCPDLKRGNFSADEDELIIKLHDLLGNRWSLIAGRLPGRTDNEIKNYWNTRLKKKVSSMGGTVLAATPLGFSSEASEGYNDGDLQKNTRATTCANSSPQLITSTNSHNFNSEDVHIGSNLHHQDMSSYAIQTPPDSCWSEQYSSSPAQSDNSTFTTMNMDVEKYSDPFLELQRPSNSKNTDDLRHNFYTQSPESGLCYPDYSSTSTSSSETNLGFPQGENLESNHLQSAFDDQQQFDGSLGLESLDFLLQQEFESNRWSALQFYLDSL